MTKAILQRTGLNLDDGHVVFGYGGNDGDCTHYNGWVASVPVAGGTPGFYEVDAANGDTQGAVWMGGAAPEVDGTGNVWAAAGNGSVGTASKPYDYSDSVFELSPALELDQYFSPSDWANDNRNDKDLGSTAPALMGDGTVFQIGKSSTAYLLNRATLGGIGHPLTTLHTCTSDADGGDAVTGTLVFVPCASGLEAVRTSASPPALTVAWKAATSPKGPPIVAGGLVWSIDDTAVFGITPGNGHTVVRLGVGSEANHFPTPSVGGGLLLAPGGTHGDRVVAFAGSRGLPGAPTPSSSRASPPSE